MLNISLEEIHKLVDAFKNATVKDINGVRVGISKSEAWDAVLIALHVLFKQPVIDDCTTYASFINNKSLKKLYNEHKKEAGEPK